MIYGPHEADSLMHRGHVMHVLFRRVAEIVYESNLEFAERLIALGRTINWR